MKKKKKRKQKTRKMSNSSSPRVVKRPPRPKINLPVPGQYRFPPGFVATPYGQTPMPKTPMTAQQNFVYTTKTSGFMFSHIKGIKDFTKSGLSVGEKFAFWLYEKVSLKQCLHNEFECGA